jgi:hypothetical protein
MDWFSWWNCTRRGVGLSMQKTLITHNINSLVPRYICTDKHRGGTGTQLITIISNRYNNNYVKFTDRICLHRYGGFLMERLYIYTIFALIF